MMAAKSSCMRPQDTFGSLTKKRALCKHCQQTAEKAGTGLRKASGGDCWELSGVAHLNFVGCQGYAEEWTLVWQLCDRHCSPSAAQCKILGLHHSCAPVKACAAGMPQAASR